MTTRRMESEPETTPKQFIELLKESGKEDSEELV